MVRAVFSIASTRNVAASSSSPHRRWWRRLALLVASAALLHTLQNDAIDDVTVSSLQLRTRLLANATAGGSSSTTIAREQSADLLTEEDHVVIITNEQSQSNESDEPDDKTASSTIVKESDDETERAITSDSVQIDGIENKSNEVDNVETNRASLWDSATEGDDESFTATTLLEIVETNHVVVNASMEETATEEAFNTSDKSSVPNEETTSAETLESETDTANHDANAVDRINSRHENDIDEASTTDENDNLQDVTIVDENASEQASDPASTTAAKRETPETEENATATYATTTTDDNRNAELGEETSTDDKSSFANGDEHDAPVETSVLDQTAVPKQNMAELDNEATVTAAIQTSDEEVDSGPHSDADEKPTVDKEGQNVTINASSTVENGTFQKDDEADIEPSTNTGETTTHEEDAMVDASTPNKDNNLEAEQKEIVVDSTATDQNGSNGYEEQLEVVTADEIDATAKQHDAVAIEDENEASQSPDSNQHDEGVARVAAESVNNENSVLSDIATNVASNDSSNELSCKWKPNDDGPCVDRLTQRIQFSISGNNDAAPLSHRRWIFLGDSTMGMLWRLSPLKDYLTEAAPVLEACPQTYDCLTIRAGRCDTNEQLQVPRRDSWVPPNFTLAEGPLWHGLQNPGCQDCYGCDSAWLSCSSREEAEGTSQPPCLSAEQRHPGAYGGYISVEFARDVEIQSALYTTTQENVVHYLHRDWNQEALVADFGRPICIVQTGFHDIVVPDVDLEKYLVNVRWYADLLLTVCDHVAWLANTCPEADEFRQTKVQTIEWNNAVRDFLSDYIEKDRTSFIDIFEASVEYKHKDNLHMDPPWYDLLGNMFLKVFGGIGVRIKDDAHTPLSTKE